MDSNQVRAEPRYDKYRIPPDFELASIHARSCRVYEAPNDCDNPKGAEKCGCCNQAIGSRPVSMCEYVSALRSIGEEIPLFFGFISLMILLIIAVLFAKSAEWIFYCNHLQLCEPVYCHLQNLFGLEFSWALLIGFKYPDLDQANHESMVFMLELILYALLIIIFKIRLKSKKYKYRSFNQNIETRSLKLINLPKDTTPDQIVEMLQGYRVDDIVFCFRVREYHKQMNSIAKTKKNIRISKARIEASSSHHLQHLEEKLKQKQQQLHEFMRRMKSQQQRLSTAFVVLETTEQRNRVLHKFRHFFLRKLLAKTCSCLSDCKIRGQHITIEEAQSPEDVNWVNLENPYLRTKAVRLASFLVCMTILIFGVVSEVVMFNKNNVNDSMGQVISSIVIMGINFLIVNFLEYSTAQTERHESKTHMKLSLIRKVTFFMFINVSVSPFLIMLYNRLVNGSKAETLLDSCSLTIVIVCMGNLFKPLLTVLSVPRLVRKVSQLREKSRGRHSQLNQLEANQLFEPMQFPIQVYYSILHASLMMSFFYLGFCQFLIIVELPALALMYLSAKWMLLRVCKQPKGISLKLNNLAQSLMRFYIPLYWIGRLSMSLLVHSQDLEFSQIIKYTFYKDAFRIASTAVVAAMLFCEPLIARIAKAMHRSGKSSSEYSEALLQHRNYREANMFYQIHEEFALESEFSGSQQRLAGRR